MLLSLETLPDLIEQGMAMSPWTLLYYVSYVLITVNLLVNILIGVIINSMEEARRLEQTQEPAPDPDGRCPTSRPDRDQPAAGRPARAPGRPGTRPAGATRPPGRKRAPIDR